MNCCSHTFYMQMHAAAARCGDTLTWGQFGGIYCWSAGDEDFHGSYQQPCAIQRFMATNVLELIYHGIKILWLHVLLGVISWKSFSKIFKFVVIKNIVSLNSKNRDRPVECINVCMHTEYTLPLDGFCCRGQILVQGQNWGSKTVLCCHGYN